MKIVPTAGPVITPQTSPGVNAEARERAIAKLVSAPPVPVNANAIFSRRDWCSNSSKSPGI